MAAGSGSRSSGGAIPPAGCWEECGIARSRSSERSGPAAEPPSGADRPHELAGGSWVRGPARWLPGSQQTVGRCVMSRREDAVLSRALPAGLSAAAQGQDRPRRRHCACSTTCTVSLRCWCWTDGWGSATMSGRPGAPAPQQQPAASIESLPDALLALIFTAAGRRAGVSAAGRSRRWRRRRLTRLLAGLLRRLPQAHRCRLATLCRPPSRGSATAGTASSSLSRPCGGS